MIIRRNDFQIQRVQEPSQTIPEVWTPREREVMSMNDFSAMLRRRILTIVVVAAVILGAGVYYTLTRPPIYESTAKMMVITPKNTAAVVGDGRLISDLEALKGARNADTQVEIITSPDTIQVAAKLIPEDIRKYGLGGTEVPPWAYRVVKRKESDIITVTGRAYTPVAAVQIAEALIKAHFQKDLERNRLATKQARQYAENEMLSAKNELSAARIQLAQFKTVTGLYAPETQMNASAERMTTLNDELSGAHADVEAGRRQMATLRSQLSGQSETVVSGTVVTDNPQFTAAMNRIDALQSERAQLIQEFTPTSREVQTINDRVRREEARLRSIAKTTVSSEQMARNPVRENVTNRYIETLAAYSAATARMNALERQVSQGKRAVTSLPEHERQLNERQQNVQLLQSRYESLSGNYHTLLLNEQSIMPSGMKFANAGLPTKASYPNKIANTLFFMILGIAFGIPVAILAERRDSRLHDQNVIDRSTGLPSLSVIPRAKADSVHIRDGSSADGATIESYRILRNNILFASAGDHLKVLAVTSPGRGEGKSTTTMNLAATMAMEGKRVLMVDADLRRPSLHRVLGVSREKGLTGVIGGNVALEDAIVETKTSNVFLLPAGPSCQNPGETLNSAPSRELFRKLSGMYDLVLVDCPPSTGLSDVQIISTLSDAVLLVVSMHQSLRPQLEITLQTLARAGAPLIGTVLNRVDIRSSDYCYYYSQDEYKQDNEQS